MSSCCLRNAALVSDRRQTSFGPTTPAAIHRFHVGVPHFLEIIGDESRTVTATTVEDEFGGWIGNLLLDVALDHAFAHVNCAG